jgi:hypothetical protein
MDRTVLDQSGNDWLQSDAFLDNSPDSLGFGLIPLDLQMGAGHLDAKRAVQQFRPGEFDNAGTANVPAIGWDYGHTNGTGTAIKYRFAQQLVAGSFVSITVTFDRRVVFETDNGTTNQFDVGDSFAQSESVIPGQDQTNDLDIFLLPAGAPNADNPIAFSQSAEDALDHLFAQVPATGMYEFWIQQFDSDLGNGQDYAVAWWANPFVPPASTSSGDYDGNGIVDASDYHTWKDNYGTTLAAADGNGDGAVNSADYTIWRNNLGETVGSGTESVPEPGILGLFAVAGVILACRRRAA